MTWCLKRLANCEQSKQTSLKLSLNFEWAVGGVTISPYKPSLRSPWWSRPPVYSEQVEFGLEITKGLLFRYPFIFRDCCHGAGIASNKDIKSNISFREKFTRLWLHWKINWFFSVTKSPILTIHLLTKLWLKTNLPLIQINQLFQRTVLKICKYIVTGGCRAMWKTLKTFPVILRKVYL